MPVSVQLLLPLIRGEEFQRYPPCVLSFFLSFLPIPHCKLIATTMTTTDTSLYMNSDYYL